jgi:ParB family chromosome partitioning protein
MLENKLQFPKKQKENDLKNICYIDIDSIRPNPYQPRKQFSKGALEELCESIQQYGVIQPINVRKISNSKYELVAGERRLRAAVMAGLKEIPAIVININDNDSAVLALIENLQREDLNYLEEAEGYSNLINEHGLTQEELAQKIGKSQSTVANKIRLLRLPPLVKKILSDNNLTSLQPAGHRLWIRSSHDRPRAGISARNPVPYAQGCHIRQRLRADGICQARHRQSWRICGKACQR